MSGRTLGEHLSEEVQSDLAMAVWFDEARQGRVPWSADCLLVIKCSRAELSSLPTSSVRMRSSVEFSHDGGLQ